MVPWLTFKAHQLGSLRVPFKLKWTFSVKISSKCHHKITPFISVRMFGHWPIVDGLSVPALSLNPRHSKHSKVKKIVSINVCVHSFWVFLHAALLILNLIQFLFAQKLHWTPKMDMVEFFHNLSFSLLPSQHNPTIRSGSRQEKARWSFSFSHSLLGIYCCLFVSGYPKILDSFTNPMNSFTGWSLSHLNLLERILFFYNWKYSLLVFM